MAVKWSDWDIETLIELNSKNVDRNVIAECLGRSKKAVTHRILNMGLPNRYLAKQKKYDPDYQGKPHKRTVGLLSELVIKTMFLRLGYRVFNPENPLDPTDMILKKGSKTCNIQVKTASYRESKDYYHCNLYRHMTNDKIGGKYTYQDYEKEDVDFFLINLEKHNTVYVIPFSHVKTQMKYKKLSLYPHREKRKNGSSGNNTSYEMYANAFYYIDKYFKGGDKH